MEGGGEDGGCFRGERGGAKRRGTKGQGGGKEEGKREGGEVKREGEVCESGVGR